MIPIIADPELVQLCAKWHEKDDCMFKIVSSGEIDNQETVWRLRMELTAWLEAHKNHEDWPKMRKWADFCRHLCK